MSYVTTRKKLNEMDAKSLYDVVVEQSEKNWDEFDGVFDTLSSEVNKASELYLNANVDTISILEDIAFSMTLLIGNAKSLLGNLKYWKGISEVMLKEKMLQEKKDVFRSIDKAKHLSLIFGPIESKESLMWSYGSMCTIIANRAKRINGDKKASEYMSVTL